MDWLRQLRFRVLALFRRRKLEAEMAEELQLHVERQGSLNVLAGMSAKEADDAAHREFGWIESIKESCRDQHCLRWGTSAGPSRVSRHMTKVAYRGVVVVAFVTDQGEPPNSKAPVSSQEFPAKVPAYVLSGPYSIQSQ